MHKDKSLRGFVVPRGSIDIYGYCWSLSCNSCSGEVNSDMNLQGSAYNAVKGSIAVVLELEVE